ncbi:MAG: hypothetical protein RR400_03930 [Clostridia bacterium]
MREICFVCTGNTCRSPMAEKLLNKHLKELSVSDVKVKSLGLCVCDGETMSTKAAKALKPFGIRCGKRKAKQISSKDLKKDILFITMTKEQKLAFGDFNNVFVINEIATGEEVIDPFDKGEEEYARCANILDEYAKQIAKIFLK